MCRGNGRILFVRRVWWESVFAAEWPRRIRLYGVDGGRCMREHARECKCKARKGDEFIMMQAVALIVKCSAHKQLIKSLNGGIYS